MYRPGEYEYTTPDPTTQKKFGTVADPIFAHFGGNQQTFDVTVLILLDGMFTAIAQLLRRVTLNKTVLRQPDCPDSVCVCVCGLLGIRL